MFILCLSEQSIYFCAIGYLYVLRLIVSPAKQIASAPLWFERIKSSSENIKRIHDIKNQIISGSNKIVKFEKNIELKNVFFDYENVRQSFGKFIS